LKKEFEENSQRFGGACVDTGWAHTAGHDPIQWVLKYPERIAAFHLRNQIGTTPTEDLLFGEINIPMLFDILRDIRYTGWMGMELWLTQKTIPQRSMIENVNRSIQFLKGLET
jgi:inosose dehydratase